MEVRIGARRWRLSVLAVTAAIVFVSIGGCSTIAEVGRILDETMNSSAEDTKQDSAVGDAGSGSEAAPAGGGMFSGLMAIENIMLFNLAYAQVFFLGGHDPGFEDFREGEGITWEVTAGDGSDTASFVAERALLKQNPDGTSWWFIGYRADDEDLEYEVHLDGEYAPLEIVWRDEDSAKTMRHTFEEGESDGSTSPGEEPVYTNEVAAMNNLGRERVTVGSGTYTAEHISQEIRDEGARLQYDWWIAEEVPGDLVKYTYRQSSDGEESTLTGELVEVEDGYVTRLDAY